jgi:hypothetical protein
MNCPNCSCNNCIKDRMVLQREKVRAKIQSIEKGVSSKESPNGVPDAYRVKNGFT